ncbi:ATP-binding domain-containing protein [Brevibacterium casei]|uniref:(+)RNA virus helicase C-terminal domain-containing protein n=1 Tax=Brevibacterium casei TaxID=33889 RepID=A0A7T4DL90_9MICO|nr:hypothetical protein I6H47_11560 [Brevibacterium casei]
MRSCRRAGSSSTSADTLPVEHSDSSSWASDERGTVGIIAADPSVLPDSGRWRRSDRVNAFTPLEVKGLEFDVVVLVDPDRFGDGITGAVDRYVAMTRSTAELVILS